MFRRGQPPRSGSASNIPILIIPALVAAGLLVSAPGIRAESYPGAPTEYIAPVCVDGTAPATVAIYGGDITNTTSIDLSADGGTAIGDASGGDDNLAAIGGDRKDNKKRNSNDNKRNRNDRDRDNAETAVAGNGGIASASADGGAIAVENVNSGGNVGGAIAVGDTYGGYDACGNTLGGVVIDGGAVTNETIITVSADGGTAIADASGGDGNIAINGGRAGNGGAITSGAGNGGVSTASADGGAISLGDINSGGNAGNAIGVGDTVAAPGIVPICCEPPYKPVPVYPVPVYREKPKPAPVAPPGKVVVTRLPDTGIGMPAGIVAASATFVALATGAASLALRRRMI